MTEFIFGKLTIDAFPHEWFTLGGTLFMGGAVIAFIFLVSH
jgi:hypothetical protein